MRTGGQTWYNYFMPPTSDIAHYEIVHAKVGKGGIHVNINFELNWAFERVISFFLLLIPNINFDTYKTCVHMEGGNSSNYNVQ